MTISTRASLKRYHNYTLTLGLGDDASGYEFLRIGTKSEKASVEKELAELRDRLSKAKQWKQRRSEIENELSKVWTVRSGNDAEDAEKELEAPAYHENVAEAT